jgi:hypothetical protein
MAKIGKTLVLAVAWVKLALLILPIKLGLIDFKVSKDFMQIGNVNNPDETICFGNELSISSVDIF